MLTWNQPIVARNETERFLAERAGLTVCKCGGLMVLPRAWNNSNPPLICQSCGKHEHKGM